MAALFPSLVATAARRTQEGAGALRAAVAKGAKDPWRAGYLVAAGVNVGACALGRRRVAAVSKSVLMPLLAASALTRGYRPLGHAAAWAGDVALLRSGERAFITGAALFAGAHADWVYRLVAAGARPHLATVAWRVGPWAAAVALTTRLRPALSVPVGVYSLILGTTSVLGDDPGVIDPEVPETYGTGHGGNLFLASDAILLVRELTGDVSPYLDRGLSAAVMATYTLAQLLLTDGLER